MAGFQFSGKGLSFGEKYSRTFSKYGVIEKEPDRGKRIWNFIFALAKDVLLPQAIIWLTIPILSLIASHIAAKGTTLQVHGTLGAILIPLAAVIWAVSRNLTIGKWYWAILNVCLFIYATFSTTIPASVLAVFDTNGRGFVIEACAMPVIIVFLIGSWKRLIGGGLGCAASWVLYFTFAYNFFVLDFYTIGLSGRLPIVPSDGHVKMPPYDFVIIAWSACGLEAIILAFIAGIYIVSEVGGGIDYVVAGTHYAGEEKERTPRRTQQAENHRPRGWTDKYEEALRQQRTNPTLSDIGTLFVGQDQPNWNEQAGQFLSNADKYSLAASFALTLMSGLVPQGEARKQALKLSASCFKTANTFKAFRELGNYWNHYILHKPEQKQTPEERRREALRRAIGTIHRMLRANKQF